MVWEKGRSRPALRNPSAAARYTIKKWTFINQGNKSLFRKTGVAPCGMNYEICPAFLREKSSCKGCREFNMNKPEYCKKCIIIRCELQQKTTSKFCYYCEKYPWRRQRELDKRTTASITWASSKTRNISGTKDWIPFWRWKNDGVSVRTAAAQILRKNNLSAKSWIAVH